VIAVTGASFGPGGFRHHGSRFLGATITGRTVTPVTDVGRQRFDLGYGPAVGPVLGAMGLGRRWSGVVIDDEVITVRMGWGFHARIPRGSLTSVEPHRQRTLNIGVHGLGGNWLVNGSTHGLVRIRIDPAARAWAVGVPVRLRVLTVGLADPDAFLRAAS